MKPLRNSPFKILIFLNLLLSAQTLLSHNAGSFSDREALEKCGIPQNLDAGYSANLLFKTAAIDSSPGFGYNYASLEEDLNSWEKSPHINLRSLGKSVEQREIYLLTLTDSDIPNESKTVITMHNRTHPLEVQSWWVQKEMIEFLISDDVEAQNLRKKNIYFMIPMINPDGVELMADCSAGYGRCNSLGVDLEREWATTTPQPEVASVKNFYDSLMNSNNPIRIALNLHSAFGCSRYFWFHHELGTSAFYADMEKKFIELVRGHSQKTIAPWNTNVSWQVGAPDYFPESWFWFNFGAEVLALTYEDVKDCPELENNWQAPAFAILRGSQDFLDGIEPTDLRPYISGNANKIGMNTHAIHIKNRDLRGRKVFPNRK